MHSMDVAKAHEIMARFRPIAPKPAPRPESRPCSAAAAAINYSRPCRARKRARAPTFAPSPLLPSIKRPRTFLPAHPLGYNGRAFPMFPHPGREVPVERDLLQKLQAPRVIVPQPVRPVGSSISVGSISPDSSVPAHATPVSKKAEEVEEEVESEPLPAVVSDSNNRVRLANSAYKEMVGQPECPWLDSMVGSNGRRISGEVVLDISGTSPIPAASDGFSCRATIEWASNGQKSVVNAPCDVSRLHCESKDYLFTWRFQTTKA